jgi:hypothetical protein
MEYGFGRKVAKILFALFTVLAFSVLAVAQRETGSIQGTVTDPSGAVVAGAKITVKGVGTGTVRESTSGPSGLYNITSLQPGDYDLTVEAPGFAGQTRRVNVSVGGTSTLDVKMAVGKEVTVVEVTATPVAVETTTQELSTNVTGRQITELPSLTRNPYDFVVTAPNVSTGDLNTTERGVGVSINGARSASTDILLDGGENVDLFTSTVGQQTPLDSVGEFSVITNNFDASYGRASGGIVNVATKAGTNDFHGTLYEFNRVSALTANTYANSVNGVPKPGYVRNQFGGSIGGPILKNKLFFFGTVELIRVRSSSANLALIADPQFIGAAAANVQNFFAAFPLKSSVANLGGQTFCDLFTTSSGCPALPANLAAYDPTGTTRPIMDLVSYNSPADSGGGTPQNTYEAVGRVDYNITDKTMLYGRYALYKETDFAGSINNSPYAGFDTGQNIMNQNFMLNLTHIFTPNLVSQSKFVFNRLNLVQPLGTQPVGPTLYMNDTTGATINGVFTAFPGYSEFTPGNAIPFGGPQNLYQFYEDVSWTKGKHSFKFGGSYVNTKDNRVFGAYEEAVQALKRSSGGSATALNNFLLPTNQIQSFSVAIFPQGLFPCFRNPNVAGGPVVATPSCTMQGPLGPPNFARSNLYNDISLYAMDSWRIHPRVTLNLGVRWEYYGVQHNRNGALDSNFYLGSAACPAAVPNCPGNAFPDMVANGSAQIAGSSPVGGLWAPQYHNFAPRIGFAWDVFGNGKTSLRGGYGIGYERNFGNVTFNVIQNPPNYGVVQVFTGTPMTLSNLGPIGGPGPQPFIPPSLRYVNEHIPTAYDQFWSLTLEHEIAKNTLFTVGYSGSKGTHLYDIAALNSNLTGCLYIGYANCASNIRNNLQFGGINGRGAAGFSSYHALIVGVRSSNFRGWGLTFNANYTYSHNIDNLSTTFSESNNDFNLGYLDAFNPALDKGSADTDARHRFVFSGIWDVPLGKSSTGFVKQVLSGWELAPIYTARTGLPFTIWDCGYAFAKCNRAIFNSTPGNSVTGNPASCGVNCFNLLPTPAGTSYFDPQLGVSDFGMCNAIPTTVFPCPYPAGMSGRNGFTGPNNWNFNLGIYKNFKITERWTLQFRNEWYNVFNHHNFYVDGSTAETDCGLTGSGTDPVNGPCFNPVAVPAPAFAASTISGVKGGFGTSLDERRFVQFAIKVIF